jgi:hypothetical protein
MLEGGELHRRIKNTEVIETRGAGAAKDAEKAVRAYTAPTRIPWNIWNQRTRPTGTYLEHSLRLPERVAGRPALSLLRTGLACCCQIVLIKRLPNQGLDYGLAANV